MNERALPAAFLLLLSILGVGCSDSTAPAEPSRIMISGSSAQLNYLGATHQLSASVADQQGNAMQGVQVTWTSSNDLVASVSSGGLVTARGNGTAQVTARAGGATAGVGITVTLVPAGIELLSGGAQAGSVAQPLPDSIRVRVTDAGGAAIRGTGVQVEITGGGSASPSTGVTRDDGTFATSWTLGTTSGGHQRISLVAGPRSVEVPAEALPGTPVVIEVVSGDQQEAWAGDPLDEPLVVRVVDSFENGVPGVSVEWSLSAGHGSLSPTASTSDSSGIASSTWIAGSQLGTSTVVVGSGSLLERTFSANVNPNAVIRGQVSWSNAWRSIAIGDGEPSLGRSVGHQGVESDRPAGQIPREFLVQIRRQEIAGVSLMTSGSAVPRTPSAALAVEKEIRTILSGSESAGGSSGAAGLIETLYDVVEVSPVLGTALVRVRPGADLAMVRGQLGQVNEVVEIEEHLWVPHIGEVPHAEPERENADEFRRLLGATAGTARAFGAHASRPFAPSSDPAWVSQAWHYKQTDVWDAWRSTRGSSDVIVAVIDDGIRTDHPDLQGRVTTGYSFVPSDPIPLCGGGTVPRDGHGQGPGPDANTPLVFDVHSSGCIQGVRPSGGHGLHVAGTIAASADNASFGSGVAPGVRIMPLRVFGSDGRVATGFDVADAILYAAGFPVSDRRGGVMQAPAKARIINMSLGGAQANSAQLQAIRLAEAEGLLLIASAGNESRGPVRFPAAFAEVVAVSATGPTEALAPYSNWGPEIEIAAPGGDSMNFGRFGGVCSLMWSFSDNSPSYDCIQGTSMAAPHVAGVAALIWSRFPGLSGQEVRSRLRATAMPRGSGRPNASFGWGIVNARFAMETGSGIPGTGYAVLYSASGKQVGVNPLGAGGSFEFRRLAAGEYRVFGGYDLYNAGGLGTPLSRWGAYGGTSTAATIRVENSGSVVVNFEPGFPIQSHQNRTAASADHLALGGYLVGHLRTASDVAFFRVEVPEAGRYVFQTRGVFGSCGFAAIPNTAMDLIGPGGSTLATNENEDASSFRFCSRIEADLTPGSHVLRVRSIPGFFGEPYGFFGVLAHHLDS